MSAATEEVSTDAAEAQALAEATAGFASIQDDTPAAVPAVEPEKVEPQVEAKAETPAKEVEPPPVFAGYSKEQIDAVFAKVGEVDTLAKQLRAAQGKIGELNGKLQEFAKAPEPVKLSGESADLPDVDGDDFAQTYPEFESRLKKEATLLRRELGGAGLSPEQVDERVNAATAALELKYEKRMLAGQHKDWETVIAQDGYRAWLVTQPAEVQVTATTTASADELGKIISDYKAFSAVPDRNKSRLESALTPSGVPQRGQAAMTPLEEAMAGFAAVAGQRQ